MGHPSSRKFHPPSLPRTVTLAFWGGLVAGLVAGAVVVFPSSAHACQACLQYIPAALTQPYVFSSMMTNAYAAVGVLGGLLLPLRWLVGSWCLRGGG
ncbi:MAG: hypothetical protein ACE5H5_02975 [Nitrospinota bacterium]